MDDDCADLIRNQAEANTQAQDKVASVKKEIKTLITKIRAIKTKAKQSEDLVNEMTSGIRYTYQDITSLDITKKNLATSISMLKRIHLIVNAMDQLKSFSNRKLYIETAELLNVYSFKLSL